MSITIEIGSELEEQLRQAAADAGVTPDEYIVETLQERLVKRERLSVQSLSPNEADLLTKINGSLSHINWERYHQLIDRRQAEILTPDEHTELITFSDEIEHANVKRIQYLVELAGIRKTTLDSLMKELGLAPLSHG